MKEVIIGIVPTSTYHDEKNIEPYDDKLIKTKTFY